MFEDHIFEITFEFKPKSQREGRAYKYEAASCCGLQPGTPLHTLDIPLSLRFFVSRVRYQRNAAR